MTGASSPVCRSLAACAAARALKTRQPTYRAARSPSRSPRGSSARTLLSGSPSTYSSASTSCPRSAKKSNSLTMAGCDSRAYAAASCANMRPNASSRRNCSSRSLRTTTRSNPYGPSAHARRTSLVPPVASRRRTRYLPPTRAGRPSPALRGHAPAGGGGNSTSPSRLERTVGEVGLDLVEKLVRTRLVDAEPLGEPVQCLVFLVGDRVVRERDGRREHERRLAPRRVALKLRDHLAQPRVAPLF